MAVCHGFSPEKDAVLQPQTLQGLQFYLQVSVDKNHVIVGNVPPLGFNAV